MNTPLPLCTPQTTVYERRGIAVRAWRSRLHAPHNYRENARSYPRTGPRRSGAEPVDDSLLAQNAISINAPPPPVPRRVTFFRRLMKVTCVPGLNVDCGTQNGDRASFTVNRTGGVSIKPAKYNVAADGFSTGIYTRTRCACAQCT